MVTNADVWTTLQDAYNTVVQHHVSPHVQKAVQEAELSDIPGWFHLGVALNLRPQPLTVAYLNNRTPYSNPSMYETQLDALKNADFLDDRGVITDSGANKYQTLVKRQNTVIDSLDTQIEQSALFRDLTAQIVQAATASEFDTPRLALATQRDVSALSPFAQGFYNCQRLFSFRDDAHVTAWQSHDFEGHAFEVLSLIWSEEANTAAGILDTRNETYRGYTLSDHQNALDALVDAGLITQTDDDAYEITEKGNQLRTKIEDQTDANFFAAFNALSADEKAALNTLASHIASTLTPVEQAE